MAICISLINMKGGVGKTTLTVALAEFMALEHGLRVLVIDLDPQSNASACLMDLEQWKRQNMRGQTIMRLFLDPFKDWPVFSPQEAVVRNASNIGGGIAGLDLMPSGTELMDLQDSLQSVLTRQEEQNPLLYLLREAMGNMLTDYDFVLIDCPPSLGIITQNGMAISDYYLIPVVPETMSLHGISQIVTRVNRFKRQTGSGIQPLGIVATRYRLKNNEHVLNLDDLRAGAQQKGYQRLFETVIHESTSASNAINYRRHPAKLRDKYASPRPFNEYRDLTREVLNYVGK